MANLLTVGQLAGVPDIELITWWSWPTGQDPEKRYRARPYCISADPRKTAFFAECFAVKNIRLSMLKKAVQILSQKKAWP